MWGVAHDGYCARCVPLSLSYILYTTYRYVNCSIYYTDSIALCVYRIIDLTRGVAVRALRAVSIFHIFTKCCV